MKTGVKIESSPIFLEFYERYCLHPDNAKISSSLFVQKIKEEFGKTEMFLSTEFNVPVYEMQIKIMEPQKLLDLLFSHFFSSPFTFITGEKEHTGCLEDKEYKIEYPESLLTIHQIHIEWYSSNLLFDYEPSTGLILISHFQGSPISPTYISNVLANLASVIVDYGNIGKIFNDFKK